MKTETSLSLSLSPSSVTPIPISFILVAAAFTISIFLRYVSTEKFPVSAFFNIGITYFFAFSKIGMLAVDLAFTRYNRDHDLGQHQEGFIVFMTVVWNVLYFGNIIFGTFLNKFW